MRKDWTYPLIGILGITVLIMLISNYQRSWGFNWEGFNEGVIDSVKALEHHGHLIIKSNYAIEKNPEIPRLANWIIQNSTVEELELLTDYPNGAVKITAYEGIMAKTSGERRILLIEKAIIDSEDRVYFSDGHLADDTTIGLYLLHNVLNLEIPEHPPFPADSRIEYGLSDREKERIVNYYNAHTN